MIIGLTSAYLAVLLGLTQQNLKAVLAYSTVSQMGLVIAVIGAGITASDPQALASAGFYAMHHGFAKAALFLSVGLLAGDAWAARDSRFWPASPSSASSVAGLPGTGGALAKTAVKPAFEGFTLWLVTASGIGTSLILLRYLVLGARVEADAARPPALMGGACHRHGAVCADPAMADLERLRSAPARLSRRCGRDHRRDLADSRGARDYRARAQPPRSPGGSPHRLSRRAISPCPLERGAIRVIRAVTEMEPPLPQAHEWRRVLRIIAPAEALERLLLPWRVAGLVILVLIIAVALISL